MTDHTPLSPSRYRVSLVFGLVLAIVCAVVGVVALVMGANPVFGVFFLVVGVAVSVVAAWQLVRLRAR